MQIFANLLSLKAEALRNLISAVISYQ